MKIPLIFNAKPSNLKGKKLVIPVDAGRWRVISEDIVNTMITILYGPPPRGFLMNHNSELFLDRAGKVEVIINYVGSEKSISLYLEKL